MCLFWKDADRQYIYIYIYIYIYTHTYTHTHRNIVTQTHALHISFPLSPNKQTNSIRAQRKDRLSRHQIWHTSYCVWSFHVNELKGIVCSPLLLNKCEKSLPCTGTNECAFSERGSPENVPEYVPSDTCRDPRVRLCMHVHLYIYLNVCIRTYNIELRMCIVAASLVGTQVNMHGGPCMQNVFLIIYLYVYTRTHMHAQTHTRTLTHTHIENIGQASIIPMCTRTYDFSVCAFVLWDRKIHTCDLNTVWMPTAWTCTYYANAYIETWNIDYPRHAHIHG